MAREFDGRAAETLFFRFVLVSLGKNAECPREGIREVATEIFSSTPVASTQAAGETQPWPRLTAAWYAMAVYVVTLMFLFLDQGVIAQLVTPIKKDFGLSDTDVGWLLGPATVIFFAVVGLPLARLADSKSRKLMLACGIAVWSLATAACGLAQGFWHLFICRFFVGAGGSVNGPATYSMIADFFPPRLLPAALTVLQIGFFVGVAAAPIIGSSMITLATQLAASPLPVVGQVHPWQIVFVFVGLPGVVVALLMLTVQEPPRRLRPSDAVAGTMPISEVIRFLRSKWGVYGPMFYGLAPGVLFLGAVQGWYATFFERTYHWTTAEWGLRFGPVTAVATVVGLPAGLLLNSYFARRGRDDTNILVLVIGQGLAAPFAVFGPLMPDPWLALIASGVVGLGGTIGAASQNAAFQLITPAPIRAQATALYLFVFTLGLGIGPLVLGWITDHVFGDESALRWAMAAMGIVLMPLAVYFYASGLKPYAAEIARLREG